MRDSHALFSATCAAAGGEDPRHPAGIVGQCRPDLETRVRGPSTGLLDRAIPFQPLSAETANEGGSDHAKSVIDSLNDHVLHEENDFR